TRLSRTRRAISCVYCDPKSRTRTVSFGCCTFAFYRSDLARRRPRRAKRRRRRFCQLNRRRKGGREDVRREFYEFGITMSRVAGLKPELEAHPRRYGAAGEPPSDALWIFRSERLSQSLPSAHNSPWPSTFPIG